MSQRLPSQGRACCAQSRYIVREPLFPPMLDLGKALFPPHASQHQPRSRSGSPLLFPPTPPVFNPSHCSAFTQNGAQIGTVQAYGSRLADHVPGCSLESHPLLVICLSKNMTTCQHPRFIGAHQRPVKINAHYSPPMKRG